MTKSDANRPNLFALTEKWASLTLGKALQCGMRQVFEYEKRNQSELYTQQSPKGLILTKSEPACFVGSKGVLHSKGEVE